MANMKTVQEDAKMDMTPMIDCVFLLMIFFVLVIDLSQQDLEDLILPKAVFMEPDDDTQGVRPIVNIPQSGDIFYHGTKYYDVESGEDYSGMRTTAVWRSSYGSGARSSTSPCSHWMGGARR